MSVAHSLCLVLRSRLFKAAVIRIVQQFVMFELAPTDSTDASQKTLFCYVTPFETIVT